MRTTRLVVAILGLALVFGLAWRQRAPRPAPRAAKQLTTRRAPEPPRVIARVGPRELTDADLQRYQRVRQLTTGAGVEGMALDELCERTLLALAAAENHLATTDAELHEERLRRVLIIGAVAQTSAPVPQPSRVAPVWQRASPFAVGEEILRQSGVGDNDFSVEVQADLVASKVKQKLVYDEIVIANKDLLAAWRREQPGAAGPDEAALQRVRQRLRRERGAADVVRLVEELRRKWKVELVQ